MIDKRVFDRYRVNFKCYVAFPEDVRIYEAQLLDLSLTGMRLVTEAPLAPGKIIHFSFTSNPPVKGKARVAWCNQKGKEYMAGLEITELSDRFREALQKVINDLTLQNLTDSYCR